MSSDSPRKVGACRQCHSRKVRCDRNPDGCAACRRFEYECSIVHGEGLADDSNPTHRAPLTQGGLKRRRAPTACAECQRLKARCSGDLPCTRCRDHGQSCSFANSVKSPRTRLPSGQDAPLRSPAPAQETAQGSVTASLGEDQMRRLIEAYFDQNDSAGRVFLHKASVLTDLHDGDLDPLVTRALCALGMRHDEPSAATLEHADDMMAQVESAILARMGHITLSRLQALTLLLHYRRMSAKRNELWMLLSLAARMAFTLCLNHEHEDLSPVRQESNRRLMWSIYSLDSLGCAGIDSLAVCPLANLHIRLPYDDHSYSIGLPSLNAPIGQGPLPMATHSEDATAKIIRLMPIRHQILRYTRRVIASGQTPWTTRTELEDLWSQLQTARSGLPPELQCSRQNLAFRAMTPQFTAFVMLHAHWYQMCCDLTRLLLLGKRESVSAEAFAATPPEYITRCQRQCLQSAKEAIDFFELVHDLPGRKRVDDSFFGVTAYQMTQISCGNCAVDGPTSRSVLQRQLRKILALVKEPEGANVALKNCAVDIRRMISATCASGTSTPHANEGHASTVLANPEYVFMSKHSTLPTTESGAAATVTDREGAAGSGADGGAQQAANEPSADMNPLTASASEETQLGAASPLWRPASAVMDVDFTNGDIFGLYNFAPDSTYYVDPFDIRFDTL